MAGQYYHVLVIPGIAAISWPGACYIVQLTRTQTAGVVALRVVILATLVDLISLTSLGKGNPATPQIYRD